MSRPYLGSQLQRGRTLTFCVLDAIGRSIVSGYYEDIRFPTEAELSEQYGVSRSVIREVVKMLTAKGLLCARPRQGTMTRSKASWNLFDRDVLRWLLDLGPSPHLLRQLVQVCAAFEPDATALAVELANESDRDIIISNLTLLAEGEDDPESTLKAHLAFHSRILIASHNSFFAQMQGIISALLRSSIISTAIARKNPSTVQAHVSLRAAMMLRHPNNARIAMHMIVTSMLKPIDAVAPRRHEQSPTQTRVPPTEGIADEKLPKQSTPLSG